MCVCIFERAPKEPVGGGAPVGDVIEEHLQFVVVVKVCGDNSANRWWHGKLLGCYVLTAHEKPVRHTHLQTLYTHCISRLKLPFRRVNTKKSHYFYRCYIIMQVKDRLTSTFVVFLYYYFLNNNLYCLHINLAILIYWIFLVIIVTLLSHV